MFHSRISIEGAARLCINKFRRTLQRTLSAHGTGALHAYTQSMACGFAKHLGKLARKAGFVAVLARFATASA